MSDYDAQFVPGTALPLKGPGGSDQSEGRGQVILRPERHPRSLLERISARDDIDPHEQAVVAAALRAFDRRPKHERSIFFQVGGTTDSTTGNLVSFLYEVPQGMEGHVTNVTVDAPDTAAITPSAPFANAASFQFLAVAPPATAIGNATAATTALRAGLVAFAPTAAGGPIIPGQWTFTDSVAPIAYGGEAFWYVLVGGSQAGIAGKRLQLSIRVDLYEKQPI